jgi:hypothetical protein
MSVAEQADPELEIGRVIERTFRLITHNIGVFAALGMAVNLPYAIVVWFTAQLEQGDTFLGVLFPVVEALVFLAVWNLLQAAVTHASVEDLNGRRPSFGASLAVALASVLSLIGLALVYGAGVGLGLLLLIFPGILAMVRWSVAVPVLLVERRGVFDSLSRSSGLVRGYGPNVFGLLIIFGLANLAFSMLVRAVTGALAGQALVGTLLSPSLLVVLAADVIANGVSTIVGAAGIAALYYELRVTKEGIDPEALASVFD